MYIFGRFLQSRIKRSQVMFMANFGQTAPKFSYGYGCYGYG